MHIKFKVTEKLLETVGEFGLVGAIGKENKDAPHGFWLAETAKKVTLVFPETSDKFRKDNNGPKQFVINEYTMRIFLNDVLYLQSQGIEVATEKEVVDS